MSGDRAIPTIQLTGSPMLGIVQAILEVETVVGHPVTVIGGLAVICRIGSAYRATGDLDTVHRRGPKDSSDLEVLIASGARTNPPAGVLIDTPSGEIHVDILEVRDADLELRSDDPGDRLHVLSHAWAAATASRVRIRTATDGQPPTTTAAVAETGPLVAMKLQSAENRPSAKAGTDLLDIVRLTLGRNTRTSVLDQCSTCDNRLAEAAMKYVQRWFRQSRIQTRRQIQAVGGTDVTIETLELVNELLEGAFAR